MHDGVEPADDCPRRRSSPGQRASPACEHPDTACACAYAAHQCPSYQHTHQCRPGSRAASQGFLRKGEQYHKHTRGNCLNQRRAAKRHGHKREFGRTRDGCHTTGRRAAKRHRYKREFRRAPDYYRTVGRCQAGWDFHRRPGKQRGRGLDAGFNGPDNGECHREREFACILAERPAGEQHGEREARRDLDESSASAKNGDRKSPEKLAESLRGHTRLRQRAAAASISKSDDDHDHHHK
jgi:hypothetical protein